MPGATRHHRRPANGSLGTFHRQHLATHPPRYQRVPKMTASEAKKREMKVNRSGRVYELRHPWPLDCFVQGGKSGIVFKTGSLEDVLTDPTKGAEAVRIVLDVDGGKDEAKKSAVPAHYRTAYFEAFPRDPDTFIRGEGKTLEEAEDKAWAKFERQSACPGHTFERQGYRNGAGICSQCKLFRSAVFEPLEHCGQCQKPTYYGQSIIDGLWYCEEHHPSAEFSRVGERIAKDSEEDASRLSFLIFEAMHQRNFSSDELTEWRLTLAELASRHPEHKDGLAGVLAFIERRVKTAAFRTTN